MVERVKVVILDHHLMLDSSGVAWLKALSKTTGKHVYCAADLMSRRRRLLEARWERLYVNMPVPAGWHERRARGEMSIEAFVEGLRDRAGQ